MFNLLMGGSSALSFGVADFMGSQSSERIGALRALAGMLFVSTLVLTVYLFANSKADELLLRENAYGLLFGIVHGVSMAIALLLFFHAMATGKLTVVAPIIAAHPVFIVGFALFTGNSLALLQLIAIAVILIGVALVGANSHSHIDENKAPTGKKYAPTRQVVGISLASSILYAGAIIALQQAGNHLEELSVLWLGRSFGFLTILSIILFQRRSPLPPSARWWPFFLLHGILDSAGMLFILLGTSGSAADTLTAVMASTFPLITVLLAWIFLKERMVFWQIVGSAFIFVGVAALLGF